MTGISTLGALLGVLFYVWSKPLVSKKGRGKLTLDDAGAMFLALVLLGAFR